MSDVRYNYEAGISLVGTIYLIHTGVTGSFILFYVNLLLYASCNIKEALRSEESNTQVD